jgi:hypothetical protein
MPREMMRVKTARNILLACGAYYCAQWLAAIVMTLLRILASAATVRDDFLHALARPFTTSLPDALAAAACGILVALFADSPNPARWTLLPAALLFLASTSDARFALTWADTASQIAAAALPALVCIAAGRAAAWHRRVGSR